jgi:hypothetical protein
MNEVKRGVDGPKFIIISWKEVVEWGQVEFTKLWIRKVPATKPRHQMTLFPRQAYPCLGVEKHGHQIKYTMWIHEVYIKKRYHGHEKIHGGSMSK